jgi:hypothetical protein
MGRDLLETSLFKNRPNIDLLDEGEGEGDFVISASILVEDLGITLFELSFVFLLFVPAKRKVASLSLYYKIKMT